MRAELDHEIHKNDRLYRSLPQCHRCPLLQNKITALKRELHQELRGRRRGGAGPQEEEGGCQAQQQQQGGGTRGTRERTRSPACGPSSEPGGGSRRDHKRARSGEASTPPADPARPSSQPRASPTAPPVLDAAVTLTPLLEAAPQAGGESLLSVPLHELLRQAERRMLDGGPGVSPELQRVTRTFASRRDALMAAAGPRAAEYQKQSLERLEQGGGPGFEWDCGQHPGLVWEAQAVYNMLFQ
jgi:hypothetical protein